MQRRFNLLRENNDIVKSMGMLKEEVKGNQHGHTLKLKLGEGNKGSDGEKGKQAKDAPNDRKTINNIATRKRPTSPQLRRGDLNCKRVITVGKQAITRKLDHQRLTTIHVPQPKGDVQSLPTVHPQPLNNVEAGVIP
ncbi:hypothetical protein J1N35_017368 [Gossypium stocksii]|uniref:Uncharacterized protein n=1 Tax=Gossypium stocksii TaxID=47602 RepID=A0A9D3VLY5_9ROSI|nr:hypothetical protein J1N35_017368 [Gossypium stocksii]